MRYKLLYNLFYDFKITALIGLIFFQLIIGCNKKQQEETAKKITETAKQTQIDEYQNFTPSLEDPYLSSPICYPLKIDWEQGYYGRITSWISFGMVCRNNVVYVQGETWFGAYATVDGRNLWMIDTLTAKSTPAIDDSVVYINTGNSVAALNQKDGSPIWNCPLSTPGASDVIKVNDMIVLINASGSMVGINARTGEKAWLANCNKAVRTNPVASKNGIVVVAGRTPYATSWGDIIGVDANNGRIIWNKRIREAFRAPFIHEEVAYISAVAKSVIAINVNYGETVWQIKLPVRRGSLFASPVADESHVYVGTTEGEVVALNIEDGTVAWISKGVGYVQGITLLDSSQILISSYNHIEESNPSCHILDCQDGHRMQRLIGIGSHRRSGLKHGGRLFLSSGGKVVSLVRTEQQKGADL